MWQVELELLQTCYLSWCRGLGRLKGTQIVPLSFKSSWITFKNRRCLGCQDTSFVEWLLDKQNSLFDSALFTIVKGVYNQLTLLCLMIMHHEICTTNQLDFCRETIWLPSANVCFIERYHVSLWQLSSARALVPVTLMLLVSRMVLTASFFLHTLLLQLLQIPGMMTCWLCFSAVGWFSEGKKTKKRIPFLVPPFYETNKEDSKHVCVCVLIYGCMYIMSYAVMKCIDIYL